MDEDDKKLFLNSRRLTEFPSISKDVVFLDIKKNMLKEIQLPPDSAIEQLDVSDNLIESLSYVSGLKYLKILDFGYNLIKRIPKLDLPSIEELYLMCNDIECVENLSFPSLKKIDMANNELKTLSGLECTKITEGYFGANQIADLCDMNHFERLKILDLQFNAFQKFDCSNLPLTIEILLLNSNKKLSEIHNLDRLVNLKMLGVSDTMVKGLESNDRYKVWQ